MTVPSAAVGVAAVDDAPPTGRLYRDATSLVASSLVAAATGIVFWALAARLLSPDRLGVQTALLSAISGPALIIAAGIGDALNAMIPSHRGAEGAIVRLGYRLAFIYGLPVAIVAAVASATFLPAVRGSALAAGSVFVGIVVWTLFAIQDSALTSLGRARWLPLENGFAGLAKLAILPFITATLLSVVWASIIPAAIAVAFFAPILRRITRRDDAELASAKLSAVASQRLRRLSVRTTASVALTLGALTLLPFMVTALGGARQGAVFSLSLSMTAVLDFVTAGVGISLVVQASSKRDHEWALVRSALTRTVPIVAFGAVCLVVISPHVYRLLNASYLDLHGVEIVAILATASVLRTVYLLWSSLQQARQQLTFVLMINSIAAVGGYLAVALSVPKYGALAAAFTVLGIQVFLSTAAAGHMVWSWRTRDVKPGRHARGDQPALAQLAPDQPELTEALLTEAPPALDESARTEDQHAGT